jgi:GT2 family glycosyltransferase/glycosyltransferase involved in cell wall biosynthesis
VRDIPVDVIVPIYGAPHHVERCVDSVLKNTAHTNVRVILSDDASTDSRIPVLLENYSSDDRVTARRSEHNLGFVGNCNAAMQSSENDVVLLNSDTTVGKGWLRRLQRYAYLLERVGSVTPLSNNAEVCSAPQWFEPNLYPPSIGVDELDAITADLATYAPIELPTGVGFCLYFRRAALDEVGLFDEEAFGRGYGEENDLCVRMRHAGYLNLLADGVFVEHVGQGSFAGTGELQQNLRTMRERWPGYGTAITTYMRNDPLLGIRSRLGLELVSRHRDVEAVRPLYLLHYRTRTGRRGGTEYHTQDLIDAAGDRLDPLVLTYENERPLAQWDAGSTGMTFPPATNIDREEAGAWVSDLLDTGVDLVHVQHTKRFPLDVLEEIHQRANDRGIPMVWSLHDYFTTCPCVQLVHADGTVCPASDGDECDVCEDLSLEETGVGVRERRRRFDRLVETADLLITPSQSAAEAQTRLHELSRAPSVIPHGVTGSFEAIDPPPRARPLFVVLGYSAPQKGSGYAAALVRTVGRRADWVFLGRDRLPDLRRRSNVRFGGIYDRDELPGMLAQLRPEAIVLVSNWAETYLYTLSEAWRSGIPVFGTDIGAMSERIRESGGGVLLDLHDVEASAGTLIGTTRDRGKMASLRDAASNAGSALPTTSQMAEHYLDVYESLTRRRRRAPTLQLPKTTPGEWAGWLGNHTVPFPAQAAYPLRVRDRVH